MKRDFVRGERVIRLVEEVEDLAALDFKRFDPKDQNYKEGTIRESKLRGHEHGNDSII